MALGRARLPLLRRKAISFQVRHALLHITHWFDHTGIKPKSHSSHQSCGPSTVQRLKLEQSMACKGGRKKLLLFLLCAVTIQYAPFSLRYFIFNSDLIQRDVGFLKEKKRMNGVYRGSSQFYVGYFLISSIVAMTRAKRHLVSFFGPLFTRRFPIERLSVLLEIPRPSAMGVNISRNG